MSNSLSCLILFSLAATAAVSGCADDAGTAGSSPANLSPEVSAGEVEEPAPSAGDPAPVPAAAACEPGAITPAWEGCAPGLAAQAFAQAVCACGGMSAPNTLTVTGGSVGVNGALTSSSPVSVEGSLLVAGSYQASNTFDVGELQVGGDLSLSSPGQVMWDAYVGGALSASNTLTILGTLYTPSGTMPQSVQADSAAASPVAVAPPCDCALPLDIKATVSAAAPQGSRPAAQVALGDPSQPIDLTLPCGRVYLADIRADNALTLRAIGRTVLLVGGDVRVSGPLRLELAPGAEVDLLVGGSFEPSNTVDLGAAGRPADLRMYVEGRVKTSDPLRMAGHLYVPHGGFQPANTVDLEGSVTAAEVSFSSPFTVHFSDAVAARDVCAGP